MSESRPSPCSPARVLNPYHKDNSTYWKHGFTAASMLVVGAIAWGKLNADVSHASEQIRDNAQAITNLSGSVNEINRRQGVIINNQENVREQMQRERAVQSERYERTEKRLDRILDTLNRRGQPGGGTR